MKRDYNTINAIVIDVDGNIEYVNCNYNLLYCRKTDGFWYKQEYDENENAVHFMDNDGTKEFESWRKYDNNHNMIQYTDSQKFNFVFEYDENNNVIHRKSYHANFKYEEFWYDTQGNVIKSYDAYKK